MSISCFMKSAFNENNSDLIATVFFQSKREGVLCNPSLNTRCTTLIFSVVTYINFFWRCNIVSNKNIVQFYLLDIETNVKCKNLRLLFMFLAFSDFLYLVDGKLD